MLKLSKEERKQLREAILSAYPSYGDLEVLIDEGLDENLAAIAGGNNLSQVVYKLIEWAIAKGRLDELVISLYEDTQNPEIQRFCAPIQDYLQQHLLLNSTVSDSISLRDSFDWDIEVSDEELQGFLPKQFSLEADVGQLRRGLELANSVCKITFADRPDECATGVLIAPDLVLTNYHVLSLEETSNLEKIAKSLHFQFGYVSTELGMSIPIERFTVAAHQPVVQASPVHQLDYTLLRLNSQPPSLKPIPFDSEFQLSPKSPLNILQHPDGEKMKVSLSNNGVVKTDNMRGLVLYVNSTRGGSSGSPCFNDEWKLVALHHKEKQTSFGSVREGILFRSIYAEISKFLPLS
jgi:hypothetical protein